MSSAESTPEWNERLRSLGWEEVGTFGASGEKASVRLWKSLTAYRRAGTPPRLTRYAIQVFAGAKCRTMRVKATLNRWARSAVTGGKFRSGFYEIGFADVLQNQGRLQQHAIANATWSHELIVEPMDDCSPEHAEKTRELRNQFDRGFGSSFGGVWR